MKLPFKNKVAIVTGSSQGIGKATAKALLKEGAIVVLNGRNEEKLLAASDELKGLGGEVFYVVGDVSVELQAKDLIDKTIAKYGRIDMLVNNAGVSMRGNFSQLNPNVFQTVFNTNVFGITNLTIPALPYIKENKGSIVIISSIAGIHGLPGFSAYCSSKMALRAIAESIRIEESKSGIHVGLIQVGFTENDAGKQTIGPDGNLITINDRSSFKTQRKEQVAEAILRNIKKRKFVTTLSNIGKLNAFLTSIVPFAVEKILISSSNKIKKRS